MFYKDGTFTEPVWGDESGVVDCFMCKTDFNYELGQAQAGVRLFPSVEALVKAKHCTEECGIVRVGLVKQGNNSDRVTHPIISGFMEKIAFDYEIGGNKMGNAVYPSELDVMNGELYCFKYGSVAVDVFLIEEISESNIKNKFESKCQKFCNNSI